MFALLVIPVIQTDGLIEYLYVTQCPTFPLFTYLFLFLLLLLLLFIFTYFLNIPNPKHANNPLPMKQLPSIAHHNNSQLSNMPMLIKLFTFVRFEHGGWLRCFGLEE